MYYKLMTLYYTLYKAVYIKSSYPVFSLDYFECLPPLGLPEEPLHYAILNPETTSIIIL